MLSVVVGVSVTIAAVSLHYLWDRYDEFVNYFFNTLQQEEQIAVLALIFALIFAAIGISGIISNNNDTTTKEGGENGKRSKRRSSLSLLSSLGGNNNSNNKMEKNIAYPLHEMNQALSDRAKFACIYPWLRDSILDQMREANDVPASSLDYLSRMMDYTIQGGKYQRGTTVVNVYRAILKRSLTPKELAQAATLGWTIELLQAFFLVADDVMDESESRRDKPCWYQVDDVQLKAVNDAFLLESFVFTIVKEHFSHLPCYTTILELLLDVIQKTELGQLLDLNQTRGSTDTVDFTTFTLERYALIIRYKTAYYTFYLPVALAMSLANITDVQTYDYAKEICGIMGEYFQVQADMIDYGGSSSSGYDPQQQQSGGGGGGSDIQDNKLTWLIVQALDKANDQQRRILEENYAKDDPNKVRMVKKIYRELNLEQAFQKYQEESYAQIQKLQSQVKIMPRQVFDILLKKVYKRTTKK